MGSGFVVVLPPASDDPTGMGKGREPVEIQALVPEGPVEALDEAALSWLPQLVVVELYAAGIGPGVEGAARELRAVRAPRTSVTPLPCMTALWYGCAVQGALASATSAA